MKEVEHSLRELQERLIKLRDFPPSLEDDINSFTSFLSKFNLPSSLKVKGEECTEQQDKLSKPPVSPDYKSNNPSPPPSSSSEKDFQIFERIGPKKEKRRGVGNLFSLQENSPTSPSILSSAPLYNEKETTSNSIGSDSLSSVQQNDPNISQLLAAASALEEQSNNPELDHSSVSLASQLSDDNASSNTNPSDSLSSLLSSLNQPHYDLPAFNSWSPIDDDQLISLPQLEDLPLTDSIPNAAYQLDDLPTIPSLPLAEEISARSQSDDVSSLLAALSSPAMNTYAPSQTSADDLASLLDSVDPFSASSASLETSSNTKDDLAALLGAFDSPHTAPQEFDQQELLSSLDGLSSLSFPPSSSDPPFSSETVSSSSSSSSSLSPPEASKKPTAASFTYDDLMANLTGYRRESSPPSTQSQTDHPSDASSSISESNEQNEEEEVGSSLIKGFFVQEEMNKTGMQRVKKKSFQWSAGGATNGTYQMEDTSFASFPFEDDPQKALFCIFDGHVGKNASTAAVSVFPEVRNTLRFSFSFVVDQLTHRWETPFPKTKTRSSSKLSTLILIKCPVISLSTSPPLSSLLINEWKSLRMREQQRLLFSFGE